VYRPPPGPHIRALYGGLPDFGHGYGEAGESLGNLSCSHQNPALWGCCSGPGPGDPGSSPAPVPGKIEFL